MRLISSKERPPWLVGRSGARSSGVGTRLVLMAGARSSEGRPGAVALLCC